MDIENSCTGLTARWCSVHGDCCCPQAPQQNGWHPVGSLNDPTCPLHGIDSDHAAEVNA
jgi:hypothetical protein